MDVTVDAEAGASAAAGRVTSDGGDAAPDGGAAPTSREHEQSRQVHSRHAPKAAVLAKHRMESASNGVVHPPVHSFQNGLSKLALANAANKDDCEASTPTTEASSSVPTYKCVTTPELLSPKREQSPSREVLASDNSQLSLINHAADLTLNSSVGVELPWILLGKRDAADNKEADDNNSSTPARPRYEESPNDEFDLGGAISSSQFIFTKFGACTDGSFSSTQNHAATPEALSARCNNETVAATPPVKRLKHPSLNLAHPAKNGAFELKILSQPEEQHRARYLTEGSRGAVKDRSGTSHPTVQLLGYEGAAILQVYVGCDSGKVKPHGFYQACKVYGKSTNQFEENDVDGTSVIEITMDPGSNMKTCVDCVGILKLRNADVEARVGPIRSKKRSNRARLVFRVTFNKADGAQITLQVASQPILCTQPVGQPEICRASSASAPQDGGLELFLIGKNFLKGSKVYFRELNDTEGVAWERQAELDLEYFHQMHIICSVPEYDRELLQEPRRVSIVVDCAGRVSEPYAFSYTPETSCTGTQTDPPWPTLQMLPVAMLDAAGGNAPDAPAIDILQRLVSKMETETAVTAGNSPVRMETGSALDSAGVGDAGMSRTAPPDSLYPLARTVVTGAHAAINNNTQHTHTITSALEEDSPTNSKPAGMLMDSDPMVSSTISMGLHPPTADSAFELTSNGQLRYLTNQEAVTSHAGGVDKDAYVVAPPSNSSQSSMSSWTGDGGAMKDDGRCWQHDNTETKMEVSHETYKGAEQWAPGAHWGASGGKSDSNQVWSSNDAASQVSFGDDWTQGVDAPPIVAANPWPVVTVGDAASSPVVVVETALGSAGAGYMATTTTAPLQLPCPVMSAPGATTSEASQNYVASDAMQNYERVVNIFPNTTSHQSVIVNQQNVTALDSSSSSAHILNEDQIVPVEAQKLLVSPQTFESQETFVSSPCLIVTNHSPMPYDNASQTSPHIIHSSFAPSPQAAFLANAAQQVHVIYCRAPHPSSNCTATVMVVDNPQPLTSGAQQHAFSRDVTSELAPNNSFNGNNVDAMRVNPHGAQESQYAQNNSAPPPPPPQQQQLYEDTAAFDAFKAALQSEQQHQQQQQVQQAVPGQDGARTAPSGKMAKDGYCRGAGLPAITLDEVCDFLFEQDEM